MRYLLITLLLSFFVVAGNAQADSLLTTGEWVEEGQDFVLRLQPHGAFEEDAGEGFTRSSRYLLGRWVYSDSTRMLTLSVDYFMGKNMVAPRYRQGRDFYLDYDVIELSESVLVLEDRLTGKERLFTARPLSTASDASERRKPKPVLVPSLELPQLPKGWGGE